MVRTDKVRADTTVVAANVAYPTDSGLLVRAIALLTMLVALIHTELRDLGVKTVVIPRKGKPGQARHELEHGRGFRRLVKWRSGSEGRISYLKRRYGFDRTLFDTMAGAQTWCGLGVLARNSVKIAGLIQTSQPQPTPRARPAPAISSRPGRDRASARSAVPPRRSLTRSPVDPARPDGASQHGGHPIRGRNPPESGTRAPPRAPSQPPTQPPSPPSPGLSPFFGAK